VTIVCRGMAPPRPTWRLISLRHFTAIAVGYIALSIAQFELRHPLLRAPLARQRALGIVRLLLMILVSEGATICVGAHVDWQYRQQVAAAKEPGRAMSPATYGTVTDAK